MSTQDSETTTHLPGSMGLARFISKAGYGTRKQVENKVREGHVNVDGERITDPGFSVTPDMMITIDGKLLVAHDRHYIAFNKPAGVIVSGHHNRRDRTLTEFLPHDILGLQPAGRLDSSTSGLLLISNDNAWNAVAAGGNHLEKEFLVTVSGSVSDAEIAVLTAGMIIPGLGAVKPADAIIETRKTMSTVIRISLDDGKVRPIRDLFKALLHDVELIHRVKVGPIELGSLRSGNYRHLKSEEIEAIRG
ncbi:rRNA pseudouridine synthase [bacterium]|nr:rRNA pseudouridine synthase [bacterium]